MENSNVLFSGKMIYFITCGGGGGGGRGTVRRLHMIGGYPVKISVILSLSLLSLLGGGGGEG